GQSPLMSNNGGNPQLSQSGWMQPGQSPAMVNNGISTNPQSQMLTGSVRQKQYRRDIKRAGLSNAFSALAGFGSGMMLGSMVRNPNGGCGLGMMGLGMTGFGTRNGFRFKEMKINLTALAITALVSAAFASIQPASAEGRGARFDFAPTTYRLEES